MSKKKEFNNSARIETRRGIDLLVNTRLHDEISDDSVVYQYVTSNVRVRRDLRQQIYMLRAKTGKTLQDTYSDIFEFWFRNNPL